MAPRTKKNTTTKEASSKAKTPKVKRKTEESRVEVADQNIELESPAVTSLNPESLNTEEPKTENEVSEINASEPEQEKSNEKEEPIEKEGAPPVVNEADSSSPDIAVESIDKESINMENISGSKINLKLISSVLAVILFLLLGSIFFMSRGNTDIVNPLAPTEEQSESNKESDGISAKGGFESPLNGIYFSNSQAESFKDKKPIAVMVNNHVQSRPSTGLAKADVVYEAVAEGGITRLMPIFHSQIPENVGSIRSARYYYVELASGYKAHYLHWGAAHVPACQKAAPSSSEYCPPVNGKVETNPEVDAYDRIAKLGVPNLDGGNYSCNTESCAFSRDPNKLGKIPLEHTAFVRLPLVDKLARDIRPQESWHTYVDINEWKFKDDAGVDERGDIGLATPITYNYWDMPDFAVKWDYNKESNRYLRTQGGVKQIDGITKEQLMASSVVIRFTKQEEVGDKKNHLYHDLVGSGDALVFQDGNVIKGTWQRSTHDERDQYFDKEGNQIELVRGQIWVQLVPTDKTVSYGGTVENSEATNLPETE